MARVPVRLPRMLLGLIFDIMLSGAFLFWGARPSSVAAFGVPPDASSGIPFGGQLRRSDMFVVTTTQQITKPRQGRHALPFLDGAWNSFWCSAK